MREGDIYVSLVVKHVPSRLHPHLSSFTLTIITKMIVVQLLPILVRMEHTCDHAFHVQGCVGVMLVEYSSKKIASLYSLIVLLLLSLLQFCMTYVIKVI